MIHSEQLDLLAQALRSAADGDPDTPPSERIRAFDMDLLLLPDVTAEGAVYRVLVLHSSGQFLGGTVPEVGDTERVRREFAALLLPKGAIPEVEPQPFVEEPAATPAPEQPTREKTPLEKTRDAYMAKLTEHCGAFATKEFRRGCEAVLMGRMEPIEPNRNWAAGAYRSALEDLESHSRRCPGGADCTLRKLATERFFTPPGDPEKPPENAPPFGSPSSTMRSSATEGGVPGASDPAGEKKPTNGGGSSEPVLSCSSDACGKPLTKGQHTVSMRLYSKPLCPDCQKQLAPVA
jgi:hypothetical protein